MQHSEHNHIIGELYMHQYSADQQSPSHWLLVIKRHLTTKAYRKLWLLRTPHY